MELIIVACVATCWALSQCPGVAVGDVFLSSRTPDGTKRRYCAASSDGTAYDLEAFKNNCPRRRCAACQFRTYCNPPSEARPVVLCLFDSLLHAPAQSKLPSAAQRGCYRQAPARRRTGRGRRHHLSYHNIVRGPAPSSAPQLSRVPSTCRTGPSWQQHALHIK